MLQKTLYETHGDFMVLINSSVAGFIDWRRALCASIAQIKTSGKQQRSQKENTANFLQPSMVARSTNVGIRPHNGIGANAGIYACEPAVLVVTAVSICSWSVRRHHLDPSSRGWLRSPLSGRACRIGCGASRSTAGRVLAVNDVMSRHGSGGSQRFDHRKAAF